jgi:predicted metal-dependent hydrolase
VRALAVEGVPVPVELRLSARARRISLRLDPGGHKVRLTAPAGLSDSEILRFVGRHAGWMQQRLAERPPRTVLADGAMVPILGVPHRVRHDPAHRGGTRIVDGGQGPEIHVGGQAEFTARRVGDFLRVLARSWLAERAREKAQGAGLKVAAVTVRDTRSRWGSCSSTGRLSFSWRLILAPKEVADYVVAHEVAHLQHMDHSARFWALCAGLSRHDAKAARAWLKANGAALHRYG